MNDISIDLIANCKLKLFGSKICLYIKYKIIKWVHKEQVLKTVLTYFKAYYKIKWMR